MWICLFILGAIIVHLIMKMDERDVKKLLEQQQLIERDAVLDKADIMSRKARYETQAFNTRIQMAVDKIFKSYKIINNLILVDKNGVEHQIPLLCATTKGVILFQTVDYPGKGLFGKVSDETWQIAQSADIAQVVPNAVALSIQNAMMIKEMTGIDVKPIVVVSQYTPTAKEFNYNDMGQRIIMEDELLKELVYMNNGCEQNYPIEFMTQVRDKLLSINVADEIDDEDEEVGADDMEDVEMPNVATT